MKRSDPAIRLADYVESICKWHQLATGNNWKIVIVENSNSIEEIKKSLDSQITEKLIFIQVSQDEKSHFQGNSAGEYALLREFINYKIPNVESDYIWKITGRLFVPNFKRIAQQAAGELVVNRIYAAKHQIDARIIGFDPIQFDSLFNQDVEFSANSPNKRGNVFESMEHYLTQRTLDLEISGKVVCSMKQVPIFEGTSGTSNKQIDGSISRIKKRLANRIRPLVIKLLAGSSP